MRASRAASAVPTREIAQPVRLAATLAPTQTLVRARLLERDMTAAAVATDRPIMDRKRPKTL